MGFRCGRALFCALLSALLLSSGTAMASSRPVAAQADPEPVTVAAEFVVYERPYVGIDNLGPIDLAELFHPGGIGGDDNLPCTPDRVTIDTNRIQLAYDPASGEVTGTGTLVLSCQFHFGEGCEAEQRTVTVDFVAGLFDQATLQMVGNATIRSADRIAQNWGNSDVKDPSSCTWGTTDLGPVGPYDMPWRLDLAIDPATGWFAADIATGDPAQRNGFFEIGNRFDVEQIAAPVVAAGDEVDSEAAAAPGVAPSADDPTGAVPGETATTVTTTDGARFGVFGPADDEDESTIGLWFAFFMIFIFLAAVFLLGRRFLLRSERARPNRR